MQYENGKHPFIKTLHILYSFQLVKAITRPLSKTCLDHIWSSHPERLINVQVFPSGLSDHLPTTATRKKQTSRTKHRRATTTTYRDIKNMDNEQFIAALKEVPCDWAFVFDDPNDVVDTRYEILNGFVDNFLPLKHKRVKRKARPKWFNDNIAEQIEARDKLLTKAKKSGTDNDWLNFRRAKNSVTNLIRQTKEAYFSFSESWQDSRKLWNLIKIPDREWQSRL